MQKKKVGLLFAGLESSTMAQTYYGIVETAKENDICTYGCMICPSLETTSVYFMGEYFSFDIMDIDDFDAYIVALNTVTDSNTREYFRQYLCKTDKPVIALDCDIDGAYKVSSHNYKSSRLTIDHILDVHKLTKINYISGPRKNVEAEIRRQAYIDAMKEHGIYDEKRIYTGTFFVGDGHDALAYYEKEGLLDCEAIVCANDMAALSVEEELFRRGIAVPEDIIVVGNDDVDDAQYFRPSLTTVNQSRKYAGEIAVKILLDILEGKEVEREHTVEPTLIVRESCGCGEKIYKNVNIKAGIRGYTQRHFMGSFIKKCVEECGTANEFYEYMDIVKRYISQINCGAFYFCIFDEFTKALELQRYAKVKIDGYGNQGEVRVTLGYNNGLFIDVGDDPDDAAVSRLINENQKEILITPLHFKNVNYGFVLFDCSIFPFVGEYYWQLLSTFSSCINSIKDRIELNELYIRDSLTNTYNRYGFDYHIELLKKRKKRNVLFMFADVDNLKSVNDKYGHEEGDFIIKAGANALKSIPLKDVIVSRYGGDEFVVVARDVDENCLDVAAKAIEEYLADINKAVNKDYEVSLSYGGFMLGKREHFDLEECIKKADEIMYTVKKAKKQER